MKNTRMIQNRIIASATGMHGYSNIIIINMLMIVLLRSYPEYYNQNNLLPVYEWTHSKQHYTAEELGRILLTDTVPKEKICHVQPTQIQHNVAFVVNLHSLGDPKDLRADDNGVWERKGAPVTFISVHKSYNGTSVIAQRSKMGNHPHHFKISRTYYHHSSSKDFHRIITTVQGR